MSEPIYNGVVIKTSDVIRMLLPVDRVSEIAATVLYDPKDQKGNCYDNVKSYLFPKKSGNLTFIVTNKKEGEKYKLSEILAQKEELLETPIYVFSFDDEEETMTMNVLVEGDKSKRPIGIVEGHAVVLDTNCNYTKNCFVPFEDIEVGLFKWCAEVAKKISDKTDETFGSAEENLAKVKAFARTVVQEDDTKSFAENLLIQQKKNFNEFEYGKKFDALADLIVDNKLEGSGFTKICKTQERNLKELSPILQNALKPVIGEELTFESIKKQQCKNFTEMEYGKKFEEFKKKRFTVSEPKEKPNIIKYVNKRILNIEDLQDLFQTFPESFDDSQGFSIRNPLLTLTVNYDGYLFNLRPLPRYFVSEAIHYTQAEKRDVYIIDGDWVYVESCAVSEAELKMLMADHLEILAVKQFKEDLLEAQKREQNYLLFKEKFQQAAYLRIKAFLLINKCIKERKPILAEKVRVRKQKEAAEEEARILFEKAQEQKDNDLRKIDELEKEMIEREKRSIVLSPKIKQFLTSFDVEIQKKVEMFGLELVFHNGSFRNCVKDPKEYKEWFIKKTLGYVLNLDHPDVEAIQLTNGGKDVLIASFD